MFNSARRNLVGLIALALLLGAVGCWLWPPGGDYAAVEAAFLRVGAMMAVFWLAYDDLRRLPAWLLGVLPILLFVIAFKPRWFLVILPVLIILAVVWPRKKNGKTAGRSDRSTAQTDEPGGPRP